MALTTGNNVKDFGNLAKNVKSDRSEGKEVVTGREMNMLENKLREMTPADRKAALQDLKCNDNVLFGLLTNATL